MGVGYYQLDFKMANDGGDLSLQVFRGRIINSKMWRYEKRKINKEGIGLISITSSLSKSGSCT